MAVVGWPRYNDHRPRSTTLWCRRARRWLAAAVEPGGAPRGRPSDRAAGASSLCWPPSRCTCCSTSPWWVTGAISPAGPATAPALGLAGSQATLSSHGTSAARRYGAGNRGRGHRRCNDQATWLALGLGVGRRRGSHRDAAGVGDRFWRCRHRGGLKPWLRIAILGTPAPWSRLPPAARCAGHRANPLRYAVAGFGSSALLPAAGFTVGWPFPLGVNRLGGAANPGSAWRRCCLPVRYWPSLRPDRAVLGAQADDGAGTWIVQTLAFQVCCVWCCGGGREVRRRARGPPGRAVPGVCWFFDSLAIAAQSLVGAALGAGDGHAKAVHGRRRFSLLAAGIFAAALG